MASPICKPIRSNIIIIAILIKINNTYTISMLYNISGINTPSFFTKIAYKTTNRFFFNDKTPQKGFQQVPGTLAF